jgi:hypothetical protein
MILRVEWSWPDKGREGGGFGGGGNLHYTGYGKKLAQDIVKK